MCKAQLLLALLLSIALTGSVRADDKPARKLPPRLQELMTIDAKTFLERFDKNKDGYLTKDELPERMARLFDRSDTNGDGKLDLREIEHMLAAIRKRLGAEDKSSDATPAAKPKERLAAVADVDRAVDMILNRMDTNKDGKISKDEARGPLAENFDKIDTNKDGFIDREELRIVVERRMKERAAADKPRRSDTPPKLREPPMSAVPTPEFDALDANADGRLTREEVKGTPLAEHFDEIDTNKDGKIDPKEFATYKKKLAEAKKP